MEPDMSTFWGRTRYFIKANNPANMFVSTNTIELSRRIVDEGEAKHGREAFLAARDVVNATIHPDTKEVIHPLFRFCAFVPVNLTIVPTMMLPSTLSSIGRTAFIHWFNQTYNCAVNFNNRNATSDVSTKLLLGGYTGAVTVSVSIALLTTRLKATNIWVRSTLPFAAVCCSSSLNMALMRQTEWLHEGVSITDAEGNDYGKSLQAGRQGILQCAMTRVLWNIPTMVLPVFAVEGMKKVIPRMGPRVCTAIELGLIVSGLFIGVPMALAFSPQVQETRAEALEPSFHHLAGKKLYFNKGL